MREGDQVDMRNQKFWIKGEIYLKKEKKKKTDPTHFWFYKGTRGLE
jgi:hypothetical protein